MEQQSITEKNYLNTHDETKIESESKKAFVISIDSSHSQDIVVDQDFEDATNEEGIVAHGGIMATDDQWASWAQSVQQLESPACLDWTAIEMPDVLLPPWSPANIAASSRVDALRAALQDWFDRPGCTDPTAVNYNPSALQDDGSCRNMPSFTFTELCRCYGFNDDYTFICGQDVYGCPGSQLSLGYVADTQITGTTPLHWCNSHGGYFCTQSSCDGITEFQLLGYISSEPNATLGMETGLYLCQMGSRNRFDTTSADCGGCDHLGFHGYISSTGAIPSLLPPGVPQDHMVVV